ncbi:MAG TPA: electron transport complex subunit RsxG [Azospirillum sp.]|nr:electron transport complex subunit RsxG [Azospirillum sp.]
MTTQPTWLHAAVLGAFCTGFGAVLALTDALTADPIAARALEDKQNSLAQVIPPGLHDNNPAMDVITLPGEHGKPLTVYRATKGGKVTGVAYEILGSGYAGEMRLMMGVDTEGRVLGVRATQHKETPGLGDKINPAKSDWITRFSGLSLDTPPRDKWKVKKDGGQFDQFSGATITPRGVVGAVRGGLEFFASHKAQMVEVR